MDKNSPAYIALKKQADMGSVFGMEALKRIEMENVPERMERVFTPEERCIKCSGKELQYKVLFWLPNNLMFRACCTECGYSWAIASEETLKKRTNSPLAHWRKAVIARDNGMCRICGSNENLEAHHIIPVKNDPDGKYKYDVNNGITLCKSCHDMVHPFRQKQGV